MSQFGGGIFFASPGHFLSDKFQSANLRIKVGGFGFLVCLTHGGDIISGHNNNSLIHIFNSFPLWGVCFAFVFLLIT
jgi:hypothetical protein